MSRHLKSSKNDLLRMTLILFLITSIIGGLLAVLYHYTASVSERSNEERLSVSMQTLMGDTAVFNEVVEFPESILLGNVQVPVKAVYRVNDSVGELLGYCVNVQPKGYSNVIDMLIALDMEGTVSEVEILSISESPGIGMKVQTDETLHTAVKGINDSVKIVKHTPASKNEIQVISGATVSSSAYINGVNAAIEAVQLIRAEEVLR